MKKFKIYLSFLAVFALLFTSCSKDEQPGTNSDSEKATLSFGAIVEDLAAKSNSKQSAVGDLPACSDDVPAYVQIVLKQGDVEVVGTSGAPYRVDLVDGQIFTEEDPMLELDPGTYTLDHFAVYNEGGDLLWLAPKGGALAEFVDSPLPMNIRLGAGVKKYVDVSVICYDNRDTNEYGYLFFELEAYEAFEYCVFANYCAPDGRHYPARYSVDVSIDGVTIYSGAVNNVDVNANGDFFADPLCGALPNLPQYADDEEYIDITLTLLDWDANYGDVGTIVIEESLSRNEIIANFDGDEGVFYEHFRFGCGDDDGEAPDADNDGVPDDQDDCPNEAGPVTNEGCPVDGDADNDGVVDSVDECDNTPEGATVDAVGCPLDSDNDGIYDGIDQCAGTEAGVEVDNVGCAVTQDGDADSDGVLDSIDECDNTPQGATVNAVGCPSDSDSDGVLDGIDQCSGTEAGAEVNSVGCVVTTVEACEMDPADAGCDVAWLEGVEGFVQVNDDFPLDMVLNGEFAGAVKVTITEEGVLTVGSELITAVNGLYTDYEIWVSTTSSVDGLIASACASVDPSGAIAVDLGDIDAEYGYYVRIKTNICPAN